jgi:alkyl hydroperoxide reductase subunit AhpC
MDKSDEKLGWKTDLTKKYDFNGIPFIVVIDKNGCIAGKGLYRDFLKNKIEELLKK